MVLVTVIMIGSAWVVGQILKRLVARIDAENSRLKKEYEQGGKTSKED